MYCLYIGMMVATVVAVVLLLLLIWRRMRMWFIACAITWFFFNNDCRWGDSLLFRGAAKAACGTRHVLRLQWQVIRLNRTSYNWRFDDNARWTEKRWNITRCCYWRIQITWLVKLLWIAISCLLLCLLDIQCGMIVMANICHWRRRCDWRWWDIGWVRFWLGHRGCAGMWACIATVWRVHCTRSLLLLVLHLLLLLLMLVMVTAAINQLRCLRMIVICCRMIIVVEIVGSGGGRGSFEETARIETQHIEVRCRCWFR